MENLVLSSSYSLKASRLCLIIGCASLLFLPSHFVAAIASDCVSRLGVDRPGNSDLDQTPESVEETSSRAHAAAIVPEYERSSQSLQPLSRISASKHSSIFLMKAGRRLLRTSPGSSHNPTPEPPSLQGNTHD